MKAGDRSEHWGTRQLPGKEKDISSSTIVDMERSEKKLTRISKEEERKRVWKLKDFDMSSPAPLHKIFHSH